MSANPLLQTGLDLSEEILNAHIDVGIDDLKEDWNQVAFFYLLQARQALKAVSISLPYGLVAPSKVLVRYLFELAVRLRFMEASPEDRVPDFLSHSRLTDPADSDLNHQVRDLHEQGNYGAAVELMIPGRPWRELKAMCKELQLLDHYGTVYRVTSEHAHGGGHRMDLDSLVAYGLDQVPHWEPAGVLHTAITYYTWVVSINLKVFPFLESRFPLNTDWQDRLQAFAGEIKSMLSTS